MDSAKPYLNSAECLGADLLRIYFTKVVKYQNLRDFTCLILLEIQSLRKQAENVLYMSLPPQKRAFLHLDECLFIHLLQ